MNTASSTNLKASYEFENGRARMLRRGVYFWNGSEDDISASNPKRSFADILYEMLGAEDYWTDEYALKGVKITIEIEEMEVTHSFGPRELQP